MGEETILSELTGHYTLTAKEQEYMRGIIAAIQNELGEMPHDVWEKFKIQPYKSH